ncbi:papain-like cysteine protease family protein [Methylobacterium variabile]|jgi:hypothetical protein|uniref:papain-like cysteine protease family protein n=1 Tax=Methylobacterium variabile TaxID=298794 RepID=UPI0014289B88|nr:papain-like cysteine protease family protein [Methylobacterium variabile]
MFESKAASRSNELAFRVDHQTQTQWCWAAVASSISRFYDHASPWTQCRVADAQLAKAVCCDPQEAESQCNKQARLDEALKKTSNFVRWVVLNNQDDWPGVSFEDIKSEIDSNRVIATRVGWDGGGGHFQAIFGYSESPSGEKFIRVTDPIYREVDVAFTEFASRYEAGGWWNVTYFTAPVSPAVAGGLEATDAAVAERSISVSEEDLVGA